MYMKYDIHGDKVLVTNAIKGYINEKMGKLNKYFGHYDELTARVVIKVKGHTQTIEVTIPTNTFTLRGEDSSDDLYTAIDLVVEKLERQIVKNKTKLISKAMKTKTADFVTDNIEDDEDGEEEVIVRRKTLEAKPMSEEEAILQMNMLGHDFFIYTDSKKNSISVLYKRKDGNYGIIETK